MIYDHIQKTATGEGDDYTIGRLLGYPYFKEQYKMIAINLSKHQAWYWSKGITTVDFTGNLERDADATIFFIIEEVNKIVLDFLRGTARVL